MANDGMTRGSVMVSKETDLALRSFLGNRGMRKGDLSKFIDEAVRWRMVSQARSQLRESFRDLPANEVQNLVDEALTAGRQEAGEPAPKANA